jgi:hypothetical protein
MTDLTKALKELEYWLWLNHPNICSPLLPGLTDKQIDKECERLLSDIPEEVRDFYRWRNGASKIFYSTHHGEELPVLPLGKAVDLTIDVTGGGNITRQLESKQINNAFFMFRGFECWYHFIDCRDRNKSPVLILSDDDHIRLTHTSLLNLVLTTLECYEKEVLIFNKIGYVHLSNNTEDYPSNNIEDYRSIFMKYNADSDDIRKQYGDSIDMYLDL